MPAPSAPLSPGFETIPELWVGESIATRPPGLKEVTGGFVEREGARFYRITNYDRLPPFLMTIVSAGDHWLFVASNGGISAGRSSVEQALFPYQPVDRIYDTAGSVGPCTVLLVTRGERTQRWEPFLAGGRAFHRLSRHLYKSVEGHRLVFEEVNHDLGLTFATEWTTSERFGFVRRVQLSNDVFEDANVRVLDGLRHLLPAGLPHRLQAEMSCLTDAYKRTEVVPGTTLAVHALSTGITDQPEPLESLRASVAWCAGLPDPCLLITERQVDAFRHGGWPDDEHDARGQRGFYAACATFTLGGGAVRRWRLVADQGYAQAAVVDLAGLLRRNEAAAAVDANIDDGSARLHALVGRADGLQSGGDEATTAHHFANVLFNIMRGGTFLCGYDIPTADFARFVAQRSRRAAQTHASWLGALPPAMHVDALRQAVRGRADATLERLFLEYLPLGFSRRHGDPSRPWNRFTIRRRDAGGGDAFEYEGNWRDIFQNWEALGTAFPGFLEHLVAKFVNASTVDGFNPYRLTRAGVEWEVPAPDDPWAGIGYWGDHQVIYLLKLLEWAEHTAPGRFHQWLEKPVFSYAATPYRIANYEQMRRSPRMTIQFDAAALAAIRAREPAEGSDARLVCDDDGTVRHATLTEKLLLCALVRIANLIPGGGIWMNTQRPEWNDANNALVGSGVSGVTLAHLRRYLHFCHDLLADLAGREVRLATTIADFATAIVGILATAAGSEETIARDPVRRRSLVDALAGAGSSYREIVYSSGLGPVRLVPGRLVLDVFRHALPLVEASLRALRREDGLFHAYRLLHFTGDTLTLDDLPLMLEGQVAVLASGMLSPEDAVALLRALRRSPLYAAERRSYLLYPNGDPPRFLERNVVPPEEVNAVPLLADLLAAGDARLVVRDSRGGVRFHPDLVNAAALQRRLAGLAGEPRWRADVERDAAAVQAAYERVFRHRAFTGRSGAMFAYEGLGSIYWHMVSKLLVGVQEAHARAVAVGVPDRCAPELALLYRDIRSGLGFRKNPVEWGAFPTDPYSHTPAHAGAQQPGMTGQAKEGVLGRLAELGVVVAAGRVGFVPCLVERSEFATHARDFAWHDAHGLRQTIALEAGTLAFTFCGVLVVYRLAGAISEVRLQLTSADGQVRHVSGAVLSVEDSAAIFAREGRIGRIDRTVAPSELLP